MLDIKGERLRIAEKLRAGMVINVDKENVIDKVLD